MPQVGQEMLTLSGTLLNLSVLGLCLRINGSGVFACIRLLCIGLILLDPSVQISNYEHQVVYALDEKYYIH